VHVAAPLALNSALLAATPPRRVVVIDSYAAEEPRGGWAAYSIVKAAARMAARCTAEEVPGAAVARVLPGAVRTPLLEAVLADAEAGGVYRDLRDRGLVREPEAVGRFVAGLLLDRSPEELAAGSPWSLG
jgi:benzil reductase ((S)-benzoin forming)